MSDTNTISQKSWQEFKQQLGTYVRSRVSPLWVDDIVGNILLRLIQNGDGLRSANNPAAYVQRVATNAVVDHYRRKATENRALEEFAAEVDVFDATDDPESDDAAAAISRCMFPFINDLPEAYREALTLTEIHQLSQRQAAERLGLSISGMKSRVQRGRALLKRAVINCCSVELDRRGQVMDYQRRPNSSENTC